jgi:hypothetical protein
MAEQACVAAAMCTLSRTQGRNVKGEVNFAQDGIELSFNNTGKAGALFQVRFGDGRSAPRTYTVGAGDETSDLFGTIGATSYDLSVSGRMVSCELSRVASRPAAQT